jgi:hypothetical protein
MTGCTSSPSDAPPPEISSPACHTFGPAADPISFASADHDEEADDLGGTDLEGVLDDVEGFWPKDSVLIPYALHSDLFDTGAGVAFALPNWPHEKATSAGFAIASSNGSVALALVGSEWNSGLHERLLLDPLFSVGTYGDQRIYTGNDPKHPDERAGEHDSDEDNFQDGDGEDIFFRLRYEWVLPIGSGRDQVRPEPELEDGILVGNPSGIGTWNPLESGRTVLQFEPFYRNQSADADRGDIELKTNGIKVGLEYDNTDFSVNPTSGSRQRISVSRDSDWFDSSGAWTALEGQASHFIDLGATEQLSQQVLALDLWGAHAFTWRTRDTPAGRVLVRAPPSFEGARLGGLFRLRAYDSARFSDQSALHYTLEYRVTPRKNPLDEIPLLSEIGSAWTQFVVFGEMGRVHEGFDLDDLHTDMNRDAGVGVRIFVQGVIIRLDAAFGAEGAGLQVMIAHAF